MYAYEYHKDIVGVLDEMKKELLLVLKTNNYLRAIDRRLGNPNNSFYTIVLPTFYICVLIFFFNRMILRGRYTRKK